MAQVKKTEILKLVEVQGFEKVKGTPCFVFVLPPGSEINAINTPEDLIKFLAPGLQRKKKGKYPFVIWSFGANVAHGIVEKSVENVIEESEQKLQGAPATS